MHYIESNRNLFFEKYCLTFMHWFGSSEIVSIIYEYIDKVDRLREAHKHE
jgi:hypothetical protein